ncbi:hypothetical protein [Bacillus sp. AFS015802]|nr:hypothetical protein [Bacillus sp. AFS015802]
MKILVAIVVSLFTIISWCAIGFWSKYSEDLENKVKGEKNRL